MWTRKRAHEDVPVDGDELVGWIRDLGTTPITARRPRRTVAADSDSQLTIDAALFDAALFEADGRLSA